ncbi:hypothetical protein IOD16_07335 [Saccharothrix sp. 6-C]|uniref:hypothetical protein n=1 Tax=Saccharothrix sp. 6-C TaxID=2781735 RepID=UPI0019179816|nr:hypothetical protein [Saccharothrix sp. 6-C]QQQ78276.1 hypothetical protein IOD16_07335 [Saccharothrix sp. 6-C]
MWLSGPAASRPAPRTSTRPRRTGRATPVVRAAPGRRLYAGGDAAPTGPYRLRHGGVARRVAALPDDGLPNGLAHDERAGTFYITDSVLGTITTVPPRRGPAKVRSAAPELAATGFLGANGVQVRGGTAYLLSAACSTAADPNLLPAELR